MTSVLIRLVPTISLPRVDPSEVALSYLRGDYITKTGGKKIESKTVAVTPTTFIGNSVHEQSYVSKGPYSIPVVIVTTNQDQYTAARTMDKNMVLPTTRCCDWCLREYTWAPTPASIIKIVVDKETDVEEIHCEGTCCRFECSMSYTKRVRGHKASYRDDIYMDSESMLRYLHHRMHPDAGFLRDAPPPSLRSQFGGPYSDDEYYKNVARFIALPGVIVAPIKRTYQIV
jgi:hypothetical protein